MSYSLRVQLAAVASLLIHVALLVFSGVGPPTQIAATAGRDEALVFNLVEEPEAEDARRLVESGTPTETPNPETDLISDQNAKAQDLSDEVGQHPQPFFEEAADFDALGRAAEAAVQQDLQLERPETDPLPETPEPLSEDPSPTPSDTGALGAAAILAEQAKPAVAPPLPEAVLTLARQESSDVANPPSAETERPDSNRGRAGGGVEAKGFASFEANEDQLGEYMLEVRRRVGLAWRSALMFRYSGTTPTAAMIECAISPEGELLYARVTDPGDSATYGPLCREALERAAPFAPFPFEVPDIYRSKNLEIRWKFTFK